ncbi:MAG TPA: ribosome maturation factor RimP [Alphaproteobacteria bacterium]|jgi:ribosome maturation factor RimP|nr:ribosome maturation factor RimP [Alphaproteobacteria bacterium]
MGQASNSDLPERVERMIAPALDAMGYDVVRVLLTGGPRGVLQVMAERRDGIPMTVDDCAGISRAISALLDVEDPVPGAYTLEVSSPGIDRPLVKERDFERFAGHEARIETKRPIAGRRRFRGRLEGLSPEGVRIMTEEGPAELPFAEIQKAKLISENAMPAAAKRGAKRRKG